MIFFKKIPITIAVIVFIVFDNTRANLVDRDDLCMDKLYNPRLQEKNSSPILNCMNFRTRAIQITIGNPENTGVFADYTTEYFHLHLKTFLNSTECALVVADWCSLFAKDNNIPLCVAELNDNGYTGEIKNDYEQARQYCSPKIVDENAGPRSPSLSKTGSRIFSPSRSPSISSSGTNSLSASPNNRIIKKGSKVQKSPTKKNPRNQQNTILPASSTPLGSTVTANTRAQSNVSPKINPIGQTLNRTSSFTNSPRNRGGPQLSRTNSANQAGISDLSDTAANTTNSKLSRTPTLTRSPSKNLINNAVDKLLARMEKSDESISDSANAPNLIYPVGSNAHRYTFYLCGFTESKNLRDVVITPRKFCFQCCLDEVHNANLQGPAKESYDVIKKTYKGQIPSNLNSEKGRTTKNFHIVGGYSDRYAAYLITFDKFEGDGLLSLLSGIDWCNWQLGMGQSMP